MPQRLNDRTDSSGILRVISGIVGFACLIWMVFYFTLEYILASPLYIMVVIMGFFYAIFLIYRGITARKRIKESNAMLTK